MSIISSYTLLKDHVLKTINVAKHLFSEKLLKEYEETPQIDKINIFIECAKKTQARFFKILLI